MIDITLTSPGPLCYYADPFEALPVRVGNFVGAVAEGGSVNHAEVRFTPHGTGTHTECYGHVVADPDATIDRCVDRFSFAGKLITVEPLPIDGDLRVTLAAVASLLPGPGQCQALVIRTLPNGLDKLTKNYSGTNPPYLEATLAQALVDLGIDHLLVDLPSVDKEVDGGALAFHKTFWQLGGPAPVRKQATITELIYVPELVADGNYQIYIAPARWRLDAAPSRVWLEPYS
jgi:kynurenine formamidase